MITLIFTVLLGAVWFGAICRRNHIKFCAGDAYRVYILRPWGIVPFMVADSRSADPFSISPRAARE